MSRTAASLLAQLRATAAPIESTPAKSNTKRPISEPDQATVRAYIEKTQPEWMMVFHDLSLETGWRTADVANIRYECVDFTKGEARIVVAKQTRSAQARALSKGLAQLRTTRKQAALSQGDAVGYMRWDAATRDELAADATPEEVEHLAHLISTAPKKIDTKRLSAGLLARLKDMERAAFWADGFIFSRALTASNATRLQSGAPITRQTVWARFRAVFDALAEVVEQAARQYSSYSLRKTWARRLYEATGKSIGAVMAQFGHSSAQMSMRYLSLDDEAAEAQARMVGAI
jgi:integrase